MSQWENFSMKSTYFYTWENIKEKGEPQIGLLQVNKATFLKVKLCKIRNLKIKLVGFESIYKHEKAWHLLTLHFPQLST